MTWFIFWYTRYKELKRVGIFNRNKSTLRLDSQEPTIRTTVSPVKLFIMNQAPRL